MSRKRSPSQQPTPRPGAELIIKANVEWSGRFTESLAPGVFILGNQDGWRWVSDFISWMADQIDETAPFDPRDPDNHQHIDDRSLTNKGLSDEVGIMVGSFARKNRKRVLRACNIATKDRVVGNPVVQCRFLIKWVTEWMARAYFDDDPARGKTIRELMRLRRDVERSLKVLKAADERQELADIIKSQKKRMQRGAH